MATEVKVPSLGESVTEASVGEWLKEAGESVDIDEPIVSLETDKVAIEVPSPAAGILEAQLFSVGDTVKVGDVIAQVAMNHSSDPQKKAKENMTSMGQILWYDYLLRFDRFHALGQALPQVYLFR